MIEHVQTLAGEIGPREAGSANENRAAEYVAEQFGQAGLEEVQLEPADVVSFDYTRCSVRVPDKPHLTIHSHPALYCGSTDGPLRAPLVYYDSIADVEWTAERVGGKIVAFWGPLTPEDYGRAVRAGVVGLVLIPGYGCGRDVEMEYAFRYITTCGVLAVKRRLPLVTVNYWDAVAVLKSGAEELEIDTDARTFPATGYNVVGRLPGGPGARRRILFCAHHDCPAGAPGAGDNAAGVAIIIGLAQALARERVPADLDFVSFTAEEICLLGAHAYCRQHAGSLAQTDLVLYVDGHGDAVGRTLLHVTGDDSLVAFARAVADEVGYPVDTHRNAVPLDQAVLAARFGIPAIWMGRGPLVYWHTVWDTPDRCSDKVLVEARDFYAAVARRVAEADALPFAKTIPPDLVEALKDEREDRTPHSLLGN